MFTNGVCLLLLHTHPAEQKRSPTTMTRRSRGRRRRRSGLKYLGCLVDWWSFRWKIVSRFFGWSLGGFPPSGITEEAANDTVLLHFSFQVRTGPGPINDPERWLWRLLFEDFFGVFSSGAPVCFIFPRVFHAPGPVCDVMGQQKRCLVEYLFLFQLEKFNENCYFLIWFFWLIFAAHLKWHISGW